MPTPEPVFNVPRAVVILLVVLVAIHAGRLLLGTDTDNELIAVMAFIPARYTGGAFDLPGGSIAAWTSVLTHMFLHGDVTHLIFNCAWLLVFGGAIAKRVRPSIFLLFSAFCGIAGAAVFLIFNWGLLAPVIGASGAVSGLMGATMRFLFSALDGGGIAELREHPERVRLMSLAETLADRRVQFATAVWLMLNGLAAFGLSLGGAGAVAWEAHIGGFIAGLLTFQWFDLANAKDAQSQPTLQ